MEMIEFLASIQWRFFAAKTEKNCRTKAIICVHKVTFNVSVYHLCLRYTSFTVVIY